MQLKGKQIKDSSVDQTKLNVTTASITSVSSVTNAEYVNTNSVNRVGEITYASLNMGMTANVATIGGVATDTTLIEFPISTVQVKVNNQLRRIAMDKNLTLYDLNEAMGGWGSMYTWYQNK